jgi:DNA-binding NtrC family response regulator
VFLWGKDVCSNTYRSNNGHANIVCLFEGLSSRSMKRVLIVDDEPAVLRALQRILTTMELDVVCAEDGLLAQAKLTEAEFDLVITDLCMPRADGFAVLRTSRERWPATPVVILTGHGTTTDCVRALRAGAFNFVGKPFDTTDFRTVIADALLSRGASDAPASSDALRSPQAAVVGESPELGAVLDKVERVAGTDTTVLLVGEKGTGKEAIARLLHASSLRAGAPFVVVRCGALPAEQLDRELFGDGVDPGVLARARGGTLLLTEMDQLDPALQSKLARVFTAPSELADPRTRSLRVIVDIDRDPEERLDTGPLAAALETDLGAVAIEMPSLRDRSEDVPLLVEYFVDAANRRLGRGASADGLLAALKTYSWPGNLKELETRVDRFVSAAPAEASSEDLARRHAFVVPVDRLAATLLLHDGSSHEVQLSRGPGRPVEELFAAKEPFLAAQEQGKTRIYARSAVACIAVRDAPIDEDEEGALPHRRRAVVVRLLSGAVLDGELRYVLVEGRSRVTDVLNEDSPSFSLHAGELVYHIAKAHVLCVEER